MMRDLLVWVYLSGVLALLWYWRTTKMSLFTEQEAKRLLWLRWLYNTEDSVRG